MKLNMNVHVISRSVSLSFNNSFQSDYEDQTLRRAIETYGDNNYDYISQHVFHNERSPSQCKNRWKKVRRMLLLCCCVG